MDVMKKSERERIYCRTEWYIAYNFSNFDYYENMHVDDHIKKSEIVFFSSFEHLTSYVHRHGLCDDNPLFKKMRSVLKQMQ